MANKRILIDKLNTMQDYKGIKPFMIEYFSSKNHYDCEHEGVIFRLTEENYISVNVIKMGFGKRNSMAKQIFEGLNAFNSEEINSSYEIFKAINIDKNEPVFSLRAPKSLTESLVLNYDYIKDVKFIIEEADITMVDVNMVNGKLVPRAIFRTTYSKGNTISYDDVDFSNVVYVSGWNSILRKCPKLQASSRVTDIDKAREAYENIKVTTMVKSARKV